MSAVTRRASPSPVSPGSDVSTSTPSRFAYCVPVSNINNRPCEGDMRATCLDTYHRSPSLSPRRKTPLEGAQLAPPPSVLCVAHDFRSWYRSDSLVVASSLRRGMDPSWSKRGTRREKGGREVPPEMSQCPVRISLRGSSPRAGRDRSHRNKVPETCVGRENDRDRERVLACIG